MKYIRMKNGQIIEFLDEDRETKLPKRDLRFYFTKPDKVIAFIGKDEIVKQADTIEDLCDEFVVISGNCKCLYKQSDIFDCQDKNAVNDLIKNNQIYGANWIDIGLIYIAKMKGVLPNGKIDWELL